MPRPFSTQLCGVTRTGHIAPWLCAHRALRRTVCSAVRSCINCVSTRAHPCSGSVVLTKGGAGSACVRSAAVCGPAIGHSERTPLFPPDAALRPDRNMRAFLGDVGRKHQSSLATVILGRATAVLDGWIARHANLSPRAAWSPGRRDVLSVPWVRVRRRRAPQRTVQAGLSGPGQCPSESELAAHGVGRPVWPECPSELHTGTDAAEKNRAGLPNLQLIELM